MPRVILTNAPSDPLSVLRALGLPDGYLHGRDRGVPSTVWPNSSQLVCRGKLDCHRQVLSAFANPNVTNPLNEISFASGSENRCCAISCTQ
jgi:hypothetical protein